jgi:CubicO group peptidase (beta-lactamase class C family)
MTKPITAVATLMLVEDCVLRLDDPIDEFLPELAGRRVLTRLDGPLDETVPADRAISVHDLLSFQMGYGMLFGSPEEYPILRAALDLDVAPGEPKSFATPPPDEFMRRLGTLPLMHQPGRVWQYSSASSVLGVLIARVSGQPFGTYLRDRLFEPLGMRDTGFFVPPESLDRFATQYVGTELSDPGSDLDVTASKWVTDPAFPDGADGLVSTVDDYLAFARMLRAGGTLDGTRILSRPTVEAIRSNQLHQDGHIDFGPTGWGFGVSVATQRNGIVETPGRYGWSGGLGTEWANDPTEDLIGILLTQRMFDSPTGPTVVSDFWTSAYQAIP